MQIGVTFLLFVYLLIIYFNVNNQNCHKTKCYSAALAVCNCHHLWFVPC